MLCEFGVPCIYEEEYETIKDRVASDQIEVICLCRLGTERSWQIAEILNGFGTNSVFIEGGLSQIKHLDKESQNRFADSLSLVPNVVVILRPDEFRDFKDQIENINSKRINPVLISEDVVSVVQRFGYLLPSQ